jgi:hypothetical protein
MSSEIRLHRTQWLEVNMQNKPYLRIQYLWLFCRCTEGKHWRLLARFSRKIRRAVLWSTAAVAVALLYEISFSAR